MIKSFDIELPSLPSGITSVKEINDKLTELRIKDTEVISIGIVKVNPDPMRYFTHYVERVYYRSS